MVVLGALSALDPSANSFVLALAAVAAERIPLNCYNLDASNVGHVLTGRSSQEITNLRSMSLCVQSYLGSNGSTY